MNEVRISVIIPVYNVEKYLRRCLDSVEKQTFKDFEAILIDDGSKDGSGKICDEYAQKDSRFKVIHKANGGVSAARNDGLDRAQGDYISFIDSDDSFENIFLETLINAAEKYDADISVCGIKYITGDGEKKSEISAALNKNARLDRNYIENTVLKNIIDCRTDGYFSVWNKLFKRSLFSDVRFGNDISFGEDLIFAVKCFLKARSLCYTDKFLYNYYCLDGGLFNGYKRTFIHDIIICRSFLISSLLPYADEKENFLQLNLKYYYYVLRQLSDIFRYEDRRYKEFAAVVKNQKVKEICRAVVLASAKSKSGALAVSEQRLPRFIFEGKTILAYHYFRYSTDDKCFLRKVRKIASRVKRKITGEDTFVYELKHEPNIDLKKSVFYSKKFKSRIFIYRGSTIEVDDTAQIISKNGTLKFGLSWHEYSGITSLLFLGKNARIIVNGDVRVYCGARFSVADNAEITFGNNVMFNMQSNVRCFTNITIGDGVRISEDCILSDSDNHLIAGNAGKITLPIVIENHCFIGLRCIILKGVTLRYGTVVAAGAVVTRDSETNSLIGGVPAKQIKNNIKWSI